MRNIFILLLILPLSLLSQTRFYAHIGQTGTTVDTIKFDFYVWEVTIMNDNIGDTDSLYFWTENNPTKNRKFALLSGEVISLKFSQSVDKIFLQGNTTIKRRILAKP